MLDCLWCIFWKFCLLFYSMIWSHWTGNTERSKHSDNYFCAFKCHVVMVTRCWWRMFQQKILRSFKNRFDVRNVATLVWPDLAKSCKVVESLQVFGKFLTVYFLFGKMLSVLWQICDIIGLIFNVVNGQIFKNNLTILSHWLATILRARWALPVTGHGGELHDLIL